MSKLIVIYAVSLRPRKAHKMDVGTIAYFSPVGPLVTDMLLWGAGLFLILRGTVAVHELESDLIGYQRKMLKTVVNVDFKPSAGEEWFLAPGFEFQITTPSRRTYLDVLRNAAKIVIFLIGALLLLFSVDALSQRPILQAVGIHHIY